MGLHKHTHNTHNTHNTHRRHTRHTTPPLPPLPPSSPPSSLPPPPTHTHTLGQNTLNTNSGQMRFGQMRSRKCSGQIRIVWPNVVMTVKLWLQCPAFLVTSWYTLVPQLPCRRQVSVTTETSGLWTEVLYRTPVKHEAFPDGYNAELVAFAISCEEAAERQARGAMITNVDAAGKVNLNESKEIQRLSVLFELLM